jgi:hypothetical protein
VELSFEASAVPEKRLFSATFSWSMDGALFMDILLVL